MKTLSLWINIDRHPVTFNISRYENNTLCLDIMTHIDDSPELLMHLTTELNTRYWANHTFIDTKTNGDDIVCWLIDMGLGVPTGRKETKNGHSYPEFAFNMDMLRKYNGMDEIIEYDGDYKPMEKE